MHVPEIIRQAVAGVLKFNFIESTITALGSGTLSSQKGTATSEAASGSFRYVFHPRTLLQPAWLQPRGYLDSDSQTREIEFSIKGTERGGAQWYANVPELRQVNDVPGNLMIQADVAEWWCTDGRSVKSSFVRGIVPGTRLYPVDVFNGGTRGASVSVRNVAVEFRDHGDYTEILAQSSTTVLPSDFVDSVVVALGNVTGNQVQLVYKEEHVSNQRRMCVRSLDSRLLAANVEIEDAAEFWHRYREQLLLRLESLPEGAGAVG